MLRAFLRPIESEFWKMGQVSFFLESCKGDLYIGRVEDHLQYFILFRNFFSCLYTLPYPYLDTVTALGFHVKLKTATNRTESDKVRAP